MCHVAGLITDLPADQAKRQLASMVNCMAHEAFYTRGMYAVPELGCYVGWADHRGAQCDASAVLYQDEGKVLIFAGEHFDESQSAPGLDGADLLARYEAEGERCLRHLNGWFAGVLIDRARQRVLLFNDRFGLHRIYYADTKSAFAFSSEAKSLLIGRPESQGVDPAGLGQFFAVGCVFGERTLFRDISRMAGGSVWTFEKGGVVRKGRYFRPEELEAQSPLRDEEYYSGLSATLARVVRWYFAGRNVPAVSLTGGFDSRAIMAFADQPQGRRVSYTYGGMYRDCYDVTTSRQVAALCGFAHEVLTLDRKFLTNFPSLAEKTVWVTDGTLDISASHEVYLSRLARRISPVRITGNYGSEIFRGECTFKPLGLPRYLFAPEFLPRIDEADASFAAIRSGHPVSFTVFHEIPSNLYGRLAAAQCQLTVRTPYTDNALVSLAYRAPLLPRDATRGWSRLITERSAALAAIPTDRRQLGTQTGLKAIADRLLNHALFKAEWYYDAGMPHVLNRLDAAVWRDRWKPPFFAGSHKIQHYRLWFRDEVADYLDSLLSDRSAASRPYVNSKQCAAIAKAHRDGSRNCVSEIAALATAELIHRLFIDGPGRAGVAVEPLPEFVSSDLTPSGAS